MAKRKLPKQTTAQKIASAKKALANPKTPKQFRPMWERKLKELQRK